MNAENVKTSDAREASPSPDVSLDEEMELYAESMRPALDEFESWIELRRHPPKEWSRAEDRLLLLGLLFAASAVGLVPLVLFALADRLANIKLDLLVIWIALTTSTGALFLGYRRRTRDTRERPARPKHTLSPEQLSFLYAQRAYKSLRLYFAGRLTAHLLKAEADLNNLLGSGRFRLDPLQGEVNAYRLLTHNVEYLMFGPPGEYLRVEARGSFAAETTLLGAFSRYSGRAHWLDLTSEQARNIAAIANLPSKLLPRMALRQDLTEVEQCLNLLRRLTFATMPEAPIAVAPSDQVRLVEGIVEIVEPMTELDMPIQSKERRPARWTPIMAIVTHPSAAAQFLRWSLFLFLCTGALALVLGLFAKMDPGALAITILSTTVLGAAAVVAVRTRAA